MVVDSFLARFRKGERPALADLVARHPDLAEQLEEIIPALVELEQHGVATGSLSGSRADAGGSTGGDHPESLGDYTILRRVGGGGMGEVYEAEHQSLKSRVALKVMHPRFRANDKYLRRFHVEARAAARLHHTNIVSVFDYGAQGGVCYYAMQYIQGQPLDRVLTDLRRLRADAPAPKSATLPISRGEPAVAAPSTPLTVAERLMTGRFADARPTNSEMPRAEEFATSHPGAHSVTADPAEAEASALNEPPSFASSSLGGSAQGRYDREVARICAQVADALDYAHRSGVLHRDIKPPNLLLDDLGNVWVTDFGLAKLEDGEDSSHSHDLVGTLRYMPPERFRGISDPSGDVYSLGATLYELLTLRPAFEGVDQPRLIDRIVHEQPVRPRTIDRHIPRDLETIVLKAMAREPKDRYRSAREMAEELRNFIEGRPIQSRPISPIERSWRWCKRNPLLAAANILAAAMTTALAISSTIAAKIYYDGREEYAAIAKDLAKSELKGREDLFDAKLAQARASRYSRQPGQRFASLDAVSEAAKIGRALRYPAERFDQLRDEAIASLMLVDMKQVGPAIPVPERCVACAFDLGMTRYAFRRQDGTILVRNWGDDREIARFTAQGDRDILVFQFSPDGRYLASRDGNTISVWDVDRRLLTWTAPGGRGAWGSAFSPESRRIAVISHDGTILMYDLATGRSRRFSGPAKVTNLAFRHDGNEIATVCSGDPATCRILEAETGREVRAFSIPTGGPIAWSADDSTLATGHEAVSRITLWSAARGEKKTTIEVPPLATGGLTIAFHPAGTLLASNGWNARLRFWDTASGRERLSLICGGLPAFSKDGRIFVLQGTGVMSPWQVDPALEYTTLAYASNHLLNPARPSIHRDGRLLAVGTDRGLALWDLARKAELGFLTIGNAWHSMFEPSGDLLNNGDAGVLRWPVRTDPASGVIRLGPPRSLPLMGTYSPIATDRTGQIVAVAGRQDARVAQGDRTVTIAPLDDCRRVSLSPDGKWLATNSQGGTGVTIWSLPDGARVESLPNEGGAYFSPDGKWLVTVRSRESSRLLEVGSWRETRQFEAEFKTFSPDGRLGIFVDIGNILWLIEIETGRLLARLEQPDLQDPLWCEFSPDGSRLVYTIHEPSSNAVIDLRAIRRRLAEIGLDWHAPALSEDDPARADLPPLPPIQVDYGFLKPHLEHYSESPESLVAKYTERIKRNRDDFDAFHHRAEALSKLNRPAEALDDVSRAIVLHADNGHLLRLRAQINALAFKKLEPAIADLEAALAADSSSWLVHELLATYCNNLAWRLAVKSASSLDLERAVKLSFRAVELAPGAATYLNTRGVALYRSGRFAEALSDLEKSLAKGYGRSDAWDLFFLAMAHHRLGHREIARQCLDRAIEWVSHQSSLKGENIKELTGFRAEAEAVLAGEQPK